MFGLLSFGLGALGAAANVAQAYQQHQYDKATAMRNAELLRKAFAADLDSRTRAAIAAENANAYTLEDVKRDAARAIGNAGAVIAGSRIEGNTANQLVNQLTGDLARFTQGARRDSKFRRQGLRDANRAAQIELQSNLFSSSAPPKPNYGLIAFSGLANAGLSAIG